MPTAAPKSTNWLVGTGADASLLAPSGVDAMGVIVTVHNGDTANIEAVLIKVTDAAGAPVEKNEYNVNLAPNESRRFDLDILPDEWEIQVNMSADCHARATYIEVTPDA